MPEALFCEQGKSDKAAGPMINILQDTWKPVYAGSHLVYNQEARQRRRPVTWIYICMEVGL